MPAWPAPAPPHAPSWPGGGGSAARHERPGGGIERAFSEHRRFLWGLSYRLTGSAADAEDVVQETFVRAMEKPPPRMDEPWRPWLARVALNLGADLLRRRRRRGYDGPWLPSVIETGEGELAGGEPADPSSQHGPRYDLLESVSLAFLLALEALTPLQRAVLLLRDVFDYSVRETGAALGRSEANVKTTHLRARRAMAAYDRARIRPTRELQRETRRALEGFLDCLSRGDVKGIEALLAADVRQLSDGGGEFGAARRPIVGAARVAGFFLGLRERAGEVRVQWRTLNGLPSAVIEIPGTAPRRPTRSVRACRLDGEGRIAEIYSILASAKLAALSIP